MMDGEKYGVEGVRPFLANKVCHYLHPIWPRLSERWSTSAIRANEWFGMGR